MSNLRDLMWLCCRPQAIDALKLVQLISCTFYVNFFLEIILHSEMSFHYWCKLATEHDMMDGW